MSGMAPSNRAPATTLLIQQLFPLLTFSVAATELIGNKVARWPADMAMRIID